MSSQLSEMNVTTLSPRKREPSVFIPGATTLGPRMREDDAGVFASRWEIASLTCAPLRK